MFYYEVALLKSPLKPLTYQSCEDISIGSIVEVTLQRRVKTLQGVIVKKVEKPDFKCSNIINTTQYYYDNFILQTASFIAKYYVCSLGEALSIYTPFYLIKKENKDINIDSKVELSQEQSSAYKFISSHNTSLLFAATGSGKTEIYIKAIENIINQKKQAVMLLPEISLSPQMEKRLQKVFGEYVAIWHSKITKKKKEQIVDGLLKGDIKLIAGARSALFLPYEELGLIIVDEEHDDSYKSDQKPRLNVKDLSIYLGNKNNIQVILGSATPSLNSFFKVPYVRIKKTYHDTSRSIIYDNSPLSISDTVIEQIRLTLKQNKQTIVFLPTRANFKYQVCKDCGKAVECPFCSVSLSLHKNHNALKCHYCNYTQAIPKLCPSCKTGIIENYRLGTAEVYEQLSKLFPDKIIGKFDRDSIKTQKELKKVLKEFNDQNIDILVGTQMLSKGHDYHNVTLAVVLGIDSVLNMNSYKVREKALSLLLQIAGRSGRKGYGKVLIQTKNEEFFSTYLEHLDYEDFLKSELKSRKELYPPYTRLARIIFSHTNHKIAQNEMTKYVNNFISLKNSEVEVVGFGECSVFKIASKYRYELLLRSKNSSQLLSLLHSIDTPTAIIDMDTLI